MPEQTITKARIVEDLRENLGVREGDRIAVHSSMKSLGRVTGGPVTLIEALIEAIGGPEQGTLLMPCFTLPVEPCDVRNTPCRLGLVPETFRTYPGVRLSQNHTHRVAVFGKDAESIAACHIGTLPLGIGSPFHELAKRGGSIIHIGCDFRSCSLIHVAEYLYPFPFHSAQIAYPEYNRTITLICEDGSRILCPPIDNPGDSAGFCALQTEMDSAGLILHGRVGEAHSMKIRGLDILAMAFNLFSKDPAALLCKDPECPVCPHKRRIVETWNEAPTQHRI